MEPVTRFDGDGRSVGSLRRRHRSDRARAVPEADRADRIRAVPLPRVAEGPSFVLNDERYAGATILLAGANFGSGSSREHAPWALEDHGFRAVIAPSFADIFRNNCCKIGLLPVELPQESVRALMDAVLDDPTTLIEVDLDGLTVTAPSVQESFAFDDFRRWCLLEGFDDIDLSLRHAEEIDVLRGERGRPGCRRPSGTSRSTGPVAGSLRRSRP